MKLIPLTQGKFAKVDDEDYDRLSKWKWCINTGGYAVRNQSWSIGKATIRMHREILNPPDGYKTDHINGNRLDNRKCNLRICTDKQNSANRKTPATNSSGYKGVSWDKLHKKWKATIVSNNKRVFLGYFSSVMDASKAYDLASIDLHGKFSYKNRANQGID